MRNAGKTFAVVKAALGGPEASTFGLRLEELEKQKTLTPADREFIARFANMGGLNQSAFTTAMTGHHELWRRRSSPHRWMRSPTLKSVTRRQTCVSLTRASLIRPPGIAASPGSGGPRREAEGRAGPDRPGPSGIFAIGDAAIVAWSGQFSNGPASNGKRL